MKDCQGKEILVTGKLDMRQNRHRTSSGYVWGWIDSGENRYYWSNEPYSTFTEAQARQFVLTTRLAEAEAELRFFRNAFPNAARNWKKVAAAPDGESKP